MADGDTLIADMLAMRNRMREQAAVLQQQAIVVDSYENLGALRERLVADAMNESAHIYGIPVVVSDALGPGIHVVDARWLRGRRH